MMLRGKRDHDLVVVVGDALRATNARARAARRARAVKGFDLTVLLVLVGEIIVFTRYWDRMTTEHLAKVVYDVHPEDEVTGWQRSHVAASLKRLADAGVIYVAGYGLWRTISFIGEPPSSPDCEVNL
jgi:hypothetical protein